MTNFKLCYFNGKGLAETSRLLFAVSGVEYTDFRYPIEILDLKTYNFVRDEFEKDKKDGVLLNSLNKVPFLEVDGKVICQSKAIERYLARQFNLMGNDDLESAKIDSICECVRDFKSEYQNVRKLPESEREQGMQKWFNVTLPSKLNALEHIVESDFSVGGRLSLADVVLFSFLTQFFDNKEGSRRAYEQTPHIKSVVETVEKIDSIANWLQERPDTSF